MSYHADPRPAYSIPEENYSDFETKIKKLIKRAAKLGVGEISYAPCGEYAKPVRCATSRGQRCRGCRRCQASPGIKGYHVFRRAQVYGSKPVLPGGWALAARVEPLADKTNLVHVVPGYVGHAVPLSYREDAQRCDHCDTKRHRKDVFAVVNEDGDWRLVGRNCLKDFSGFGQASPESIAKFAGYLFDLASLCSDAEGEGWAGHPPEDVYPITRFLAVTASLIRRDGWISKGAASCEDSSTSGGVLIFLGGLDGRPTSEELKGYAAWCSDRAPKGVDQETAAKALDWVRTLDPKNDYLHNIQALAKADFVRGKHAGYAASIVSAYQREMAYLKRGELAREARAGVANEAAKAGHFGEEKKRVTVEVTLLEPKKVFATDYGESHLHILTTSKGHRLKWWATYGASVKAALEVGKSYAVKLTPKSHGEYEGVPETTITRLAVI